MTRPGLAAIAPYTFWPAHSGGHQAVAAYTRALARAWPTVCIGTYTNAPLPDVEMLGLFADTPFKYINPAVGWRIRRLIQSRGIRFVAIQHHYHGLLLLPFLMGLGVRVVVFSHNIEFQRWRSIGRWWWPLMYLTERWVYRRADAVGFISLQESQQAPNLFGLPPDKCLHTPYPIERPAVVIPKSDARAALNARHGFPPEDKLLLFFGPQSYLPNLEAVERLVFDIHPALLRLNPQSNYRLLICGGGLPEHYHQFSDKQTLGIHYLGYVPDLNTYLAAADLVLNPVNSGGGVKTKLVEAVAAGKTVVSTRTGALGVDASAYGPKLHQVPDTDWTAFARAIITALPDADAPTPDAFFQHHDGVRPIIDRLRAWLG